MQQDTGSKGRNIIHSEDNSLRETSNLLNMSGYLVKNNRGFLL